MSKEWIVAGRRWRRFLFDIETERGNVNASRMIAWFRGLKSKHYELVPRIFRENALKPVRYCGVLDPNWRNQPVKELPGTLAAKLEAGKKETARIRSTQTTFFLAFEPGNQIRLKENAIQHAARGVEITEDSVYAMYRFLRDQAPESIGIVVDILRNVARGRFATAIETIRWLEEEDNSRMRDLALRIRESAGRITEWSNVASSSTPGSIESLVARKQVQALEKETETLRRSLTGLFLTPNGERQAYIDYSFRCGDSHRSSWDVLAEMQHYRVPTRLIDWSESLINALFFAVENYYWAVEEYFRDKFDSAAGKKTTQAVNHFSFAFPTKDDLQDILRTIDPRRSLDEPSICLLNPFLLSKESTLDHGEKKRIWDLSRDQRYDYFNAFIANRDWKFSAPIPMCVEWRGPRIAAQQGLFTVHGHCRLPLELQFKPSNLRRILRRVDLDYHQSVMAVIFLRQACNLGRFEMYRDLDHLGARVTSTFLRGR